MTRKRTVGEQVKSGFQIGGAIVLSFLFCLALVFSTGYFVGRNNGEVVGNPHVLGGLVVVVLATALFLTTRYWGKWLVGFLGYLCVRLSAGLIFGPYLKPPVDVALYLLYILISIALTVRHWHRKPAGAERIGLVGFVVCVPFALQFQSYLPLAIGIALLGIGELAERIRRHGRKHRESAASNPIHMI